MGYFGVCIYSHYQPTKILTDMFTKNSYIKNMNERNNLKQRNNYYLHLIELNEGAVKNVSYLLHQIQNGIS